MDAFEILVLILSIVLFVFLVTGIIASLYIVRILKKAQAIVEHAEHIAGNVETASAKFSHYAAPAAILSLVTKFIKFRKK